MGRTGGLAAWHGVLSFGQWIRGKGLRETREGCGIFGWLGCFSLLYFWFFSGPRVLGLCCIFLTAGVLQV